MPLDEELDENEMRVLITHKAAIVANCCIGAVDQWMKRGTLVDLIRRMAELADALPPELKQ